MLSVRLPRKTLLLCVVRQHCTTCQFPFYPKTRNHYYYAKWKVGKVDLKTQYTINPLILFKNTESFALYFFLFILFTYDQQAEKRKKEEFWNEMVLQKKSILLPLSFFLFLYLLTLHAGRFSLSTKLLSVICQCVRMYIVQLELKKP